MITLRVQYHNCVQVLLAIIATCALHPGLKKKVTTMAWQHRSESPVVLVQTSPEDIGGSAPRVTAVPRCEWERAECSRTFVDVLGTGRVLAMRRMRDNLRTFFDRDAFDASKKFFVFFALDHPAGGS